MNRPSVTFWPRVIHSQDSDQILRFAMRHVASILSDMTKQFIKISNLKVENAFLDELPLLFGPDPEAEIVAIHLASGDDLPGQAILMLWLDDAVYLVDWLLELQPGTTGKLGPLECSALAEAGNITLSAFLNALADFVNTPLRLSPPDVTVDTLGAVLERVTASTMTDQIWVVKAEFKDIHDSIRLSFWILPD